MEALMSEDKDKKEFGQKILKNVAKQVQASKFRNKNQTNYSWLLIYKYIIDQYSFWVVSR